MPRPPRLHLNDALGHEASDKRLDILRLVGDCGSISEAARRAGVSYKAAWQAIDTLSNLAGAELLARAVGGSGGGGARLTDAGRHLLEASQMLDGARRDVLGKLESRSTRQAAGAGAEPTHGLAPGAAALALRTSMRNQLPCIVKAIRRRGSAVTVHLALPDGSAIGSRITRESAQLLGLTAGKPVLALFKATAVQIVREASGDADKNTLAGTVMRANRSPDGGEVAIRTGSTTAVVGFAREGHFNKGQAATAEFDESAVVIALAT